jgi:type IV secretory pathway TrbL component
MSGKFCTIKSYLSNAAKHGRTFFDTLVMLAEGRTCARSSSPGSAVSDAARDAASARWAKERRSGA